MLTRFATVVVLLVAACAFASANKGCATSTTKAVVQHLAPDFCAEAVVDGKFKNVCLNDFRGRYLVLFFYPLDFTFVCPTEIIAFSDRSKEFEEINTAVAAVSVDSKNSHLAWIKLPRSQGGLGDMKIPLLSDITKQISRDYGVLIESDGIALRYLLYASVHTARLCVC
eukprot:TRINITY_DN2407_c0_g1_i1.p1 TRINITY_DN2407_c0_g1~~TRINITY_DN2407_c0_g1_i1.p1  ORF type:complete len:169 (-),score=22.37 TRINITY_DN2407_c0_g1_i1:308-814(-)